MPDVRSIVKEWLQEHGYDGLCNDGCGCFIDDLMCCPEYVARCQPGYKQRLDDDGYKYWGIGPEKPEAADA